MCGWLRKKVQLKVLFKEVGPNQSVTVLVSGAALTAMHFPCSLIIFGECSA